MIPRYFHWVWPQNTDPNEHEVALRSWREYHPAWRCLIWTPLPGAVPALFRDLDFEIRELPTLINQELYSRLSRSAREQDQTHDALALLAGVEIVARYGGACPPMGNLCTGNTESLLQGVRLFIRQMATRAHQGEPSSRAIPPFYGATPNHPALWGVVRGWESATEQNKIANLSSAASFAEALQFGLGCHPDLVAFPATAFEMQLCAAL